MPCKILPCRASQTGSAFVAKCDSSNQRKIFSRKLSTRSQSVDVGTPLHRLPIVTSIVSRQLLFAGKLYISCSAPCRAGTQVTRSHCVRTACKRILFRWRPSTDPERRGAYSQPTPRHRRQVGIHIPPNTRTTARESSLHNTALGIVKDGKSETLVRIALPEGMRVLIAILPDDDMFWQEASEESLDRIWNNDADDVYVRHLVE